MTPTPELIGRLVTFRDPASSWHGETRWRPGRLRMADDGRYELVEQSGRVWTLNDNEVIEVMES